MQDYYSILGVSDAATPQQINKAYNGLVKKLHPDRTKNENDRKRFLEVQTAYEVLSNKTKREHYDASRKNPFFNQNDYSSNAANQQRSSEYTDGPFSYQYQSDSNFQNFEDIFKGFFNNDAFFTTSSFPNNAFSYNDVNIKVELDFFKASTGCTETVKYIYQTLCSCTQNGKNTSKYCDKCKRGWIYKEKSLDVVFPSAIKESQSFRLPQHGNIYGSKKSDLIITVSCPLSCKDWLRQGRNIYKNLFISSDLYTGGVVVTEDIYSRKIEVTIPAMPQSGDVIVIERGGVVTPSGCGDFSLTLLFYIADGKQNAPRDKRTSRTKKK